MYRITIVSITLMDRKGLYGQYPLKEHFIVLVKFQKVNLIANTWEISRLKNNFTLTLALRSISELVSMGQFDIFSSTDFLQNMLCQNLIVKVFKWLPTCRWNTSVSFMITSIRKKQMLWDEAQ